MNLPEREADGLGRGHKDPAALGALVWLCMVDPVRGPAIPGAWGRATMAMSQASGLFRHLSRPLEGHMPCKRVRIYGAGGKGTIRLTPHGAVWPVPASTRCSGERQRGQMQTAQESTLGRQKPRLHGFQCPTLPRALGPVTPP